MIMYKHFMLCVKKVNFSIITDVKFIVFKIYIINIRGKLLLDVYYFSYLIQIINNQ